MSRRPDSMASSPLRAGVGRRLRVPSLIVVGLVVALAASASAQDAAFAVTPETVALADGAAAVVRLYETTYTVDGPGRATTAVTLVTTALAPAGRETAGTLRVVHGGFRDLRRLDGVLRDARGAVVRRLGRRDVDETALGSIYEDLRLSAASLYGSAYPFTVEWRYEIEHRGVLGWPTWRPQREGVAVEASSFRLDVPAGTTVRTRARGLPDGTTTLGERGRDRYAWALAARPPLRAEPFGPPAWRQGPELRLGTDRFEIGGAPGRLDSWAAFGAWYAGLSAGRQTLPPTALAEVRALVADSPSDRETARRLYRHLQRTTRYVSIQLGLGGWQPFDAATVFDRRLGDCKALTNYLQAMLAAVGIPADPVLVEAGVAGSDLDPDFPENAFNHVVLRLPMRTGALDAGGATARDGGPVWLECTSPYAAFGHLGAFTEGRPALRVVPGGGEILRTPVSAPAANATHRTATLRLDARGGATLDARWTFRGEPRADVLAALDGADAPARAALVRSLGRLSSLDVLALDLDGAIADLDEIALDARLAVPNVAQRAGTRLLVGVAPLAPAVPVLPEGERTQPLRLGSASTARDSVRIELPPGAEVVRLPAPVEVASGVGRYVLRVEVEDDVLVGVRELTVSAPEQPAEAYEAARAFFEAVARADADRAVIRLGGE